LGREPDIVATMPPKADKQKNGSGRQTRLTCFEAKSDASGVSDAGSNVETEVSQGRPVESETGEVTLKYVKDLIVNLDKKISERMGSLQRKIGDFNSKFSLLQKNISQLGERVTSVESEVESQGKKMDAVIENCPPELIRDLNTRVVELEKSEQLNSDILDSIQKHLDLESLKTFQEDILKRVQNIENNLSLETANTIFFCMEFLKKMVKILIKLCVIFSK